MTIVAESDNPLDTVSRLIACARNAPELDSRLMYVMAARELFSRAELRIDQLRTNLSAVEKECAQRSAERRNAGA